MNIAMNIPYHASNKLTNKYPAPTVNKNPGIITKLHITYKPIKAKDPNNTLAFIHSKNDLTIYNVISPLTTPNVSNDRMNNNTIIRIQFDVCNTISSE